MICAMLPTRKQSLRAVHVTGKFQSRDIGSWLGMTTQGADLAMRTCLDLQPLHLSLQPQAFAENNKTHITHGCGVKTDGNPFLGR